MQTDLVQLQTYRLATLVFVIAVMALAVAPLDGRAQLRDTPPPVQKVPQVPSDRSVQLSPSTLGVGAAALSAPLENRRLGLQGRLNSDWTRGFAPSPSGVGRPSSAQNLLWGTVGLVLSSLCEPEPTSRLPATEGIPGAHPGPIQAAPTGRLRRPAPPLGCEACDRARSRSMGAVLEGLLNIGSYTKLK